MPLYEASKVKTLFSSVVHLNTENRSLLIFIKANMADSSHFLRLRCIFSKIFTIILISCKKQRAKYHKESFSIIHNSLRECVGGPLPMIRSTCAVKKRAASPQLCTYFLAILYAWIRCCAFMSFNCIAYIHCSLFDKS